MKTRLIFAQRTINSAQREANSAQREANFAQRTINSAPRDLQNRFARQRGATIGYAVVFMVIVTAFIAMILTLGTQSVKLADRYDNYTNEKLLLDEIGAAATSAYQGKTEAETAEARDLSAAFAEKLPAGWTIEERTDASSAETPATHTVTVKRGDGVRLLVRFAAQSDGTYLLTQYTYGD